MSMYSNRVTKFLLSVKCPWCWGRSLSWTRRHTEIYKIQNKIRRQTVQT